jgi:outer membrane protein assembly factor BamB
MPLLLGLALLTLVLMACTGRDVIGQAQGWTPVAVSDGVIYVATRDGNVWALREKEPLERNRVPDRVWEYRPAENHELGSVFGPPAVGKEFVYVGGSFEEGDMGRLVALKKAAEDGDVGGDQPGDRIWEKDLPGAIVGGPVLAQGMVLVGSEDGNLYAFDAGTGDRLWTFTIEGPKSGNDKEKFIWSTPTVSNGVVYFGAMDDYLYAVSLEEGLEVGDRLLWKRKTGGAVVAQPLVVEDRIIFGSFDRKLYALDGQDGGRVIWTFEADNWFWAGAASDGEVVYAVSMDGTVYALDVDRREGDPPLWAHDLGDAVSAAPVLLGDVLVVSTQNGNLSLLNTSNGIPEEIPIELGEKVRAPLVLVSDDELPRLYLGDSDGFVRSIDIEDWEERWVVRTRE